MAMKMVTILFSILAIWAVRNVDSATPHHAPSPSVDCSSLIVELSGCLSFVSANSNTTKPEGTCCSGLKKVLKADAECLCEAFKISAQSGVTLNITKAVTLPSACHVSAPSLSNCGLNLAGPAPAISPLGAPSPSLVPGGPPTPGNSGSAFAISTGLLVLNLVAAASFSFF
ncbi:hypothetical protein F0562_028956 [Nyssa sinensis]|uniref:Bifunctional inhibitor/plant lipid transfer protein/seed storage helical domain-containing protein n=1 Tax=Nyssa sinensis TaxID=561372 RepID=A0A5J5B1K3_9ASTE|nr:hypothetical protein F0562_028956 [Nyssa sinensis]